MVPSRIEEEDYIAKNLKNSDRNPPNQLRFHDAEMRVTYRILEYYHAFHFSQPPFLNGMLCFLNSLISLKLNLVLDA